MHPRIHLLRTPDAPPMHLRCASSKPRNLLCQLSNGWVEYWDPGQKQPYYHHPRTDRTMWTLPMDEVPAEEFGGSGIGRSGGGGGNGSDGGNGGNGGNGGSLEPFRPSLPDHKAPFRQKRFKFLWHVRGSPSQGGCSVLPILIDRQQLVYQSFETFRKLEHEDLKKKTRIEYSGEDGIDSGGLTKDWFLELSRQLFDPQLCLFRKYKGGPRGIVFDIDPRSGVNGQHLLYFHFFGRILAKVINP